MKNLLLVSMIFIFGMLFSGSAFSQLYSRTEDFSNPKRLEDQLQVYLLKSKKQKTTAWILLGGGVLASSVASSISVNSVNNESTAGVIQTLSGLAELASVPFFFASSKNKNKARMLGFQLELLEANSDDEKKIILDDAAQYFTSKAGTNRTTAIVLSVSGGALVVAGLATVGRNNRDDYDRVVNDFLVGPLLISAGISFAALSIPFYVRAAHLKRTANSIISTGRIPRPDMTLSPSLKFGNNYVGVGLNIQL